MHNNTLLLFVCTQLCAACFCSHPAGLTFKVGLASTRSWALPLTPAQQQQIVHVASVRVLYCK
jgi:hypothetical protein